MRTDDANVGQGILLSPAGEFSLQRLLPKNVMSITRPNSLPRVLTGEARLLSRVAGKHDTIVFHYRDLDGDWTLRARASSIAGGLGGLMVREKAALSCPSEFVYLLFLLIIMNKILI